MKADRRRFFKYSAAAGLAGGPFACRNERIEAQAGNTVPPSIRPLKPMTDGIGPITLDERRARIEKARRLMAEDRSDAILVEGGTSMFYFTGVPWGRSERPFAAIIPARGEFAWV